MGMIICSFNSFNQVEQTVESIREYGYEEEPIDIVVPEWIKEPEETWGILVPDLGKKQDIEVKDGKTDIIKNDYFNNVGKVINMLEKFDIPEEIAQSYEEEFQEGGILFLMGELQDQDVEVIESILKQKGANNIFKKYRN